MRSYLHQFTGLLLTLAFVLTFVPSFSRTTTTVTTMELWDFEENCGTTSNAVYNGCFADWISTHGSPDQATPLSGSSKAISMAFNVFTCNGTETSQRGDGVALEFTPEGECYRSISFDLQSLFGRTFESVGLYAVPSNVVFNTSGTNPSCSNNEGLTPALPSSAVTLWEVSNQSISTSTTTITLNTVNIPPNTEYLWFRAEIANTGAGAQNYDLLFLDNFKLTQECLDGCPMPTFEQDLLSCPEIGTMGFVSVALHPLQGAGTFTWTLPAGSSANTISSGGNSVLYNATPGLYSVSIAAGECEYVYNFTINEFCCSDERAQQITPPVSPHMTDPAEDISIYPNPSHDIVTVEGSAWEDVQALAVINTQGQTVLSLSAQQDASVFKTKQLNVSALPNGTYYVRFLTADRTFVQPLVVNH